MKVVLVGINHAGTSFLRTVKKLNPGVEVNAYDRNDNISFLGCGIALWVGGEFEDPSGLFYATKEILVNDYKANVFMKHDVIEINTKEKYVVVKNLETNEEFKDSYDKLVYAGGTWPIQIPVPGKDLKNIYMSKLFQHAQKIKAACHDPKVKNAVVVGAGYIGIELVEAFHKAGKKVTLIDMANRVIPRYFDEEFTDPLMATMTKEGVHLALNEGLKEFKGDEHGNVKAVVTDKGEYPGDVVITSVGFRPVTTLLEGKVDLFANKSIVVDEYQRSSNKDVYAIGDCSCLKHSVLGQANVALATNAVKTGIVAAAHIADKFDLPFPGVNGTNAIAVFGYKYSSTGVSEATAEHMKIPYKAVFFKDKDRPEFMHDCEDVWFKIVYDPKTLKLLGAQVGSNGVANHTEIIFAMSIAISKEMTLPEIALMDFYFLPHFNKPFNFVLKTILNALDLNYDKQ